MLFQKGELSSDIVKEIQNFWAIAKYQFISSVQRVC